MNLYRYISIFEACVFLFLFSQPAFAKVYDCFLFFQELDLLEIRLEELSPHVDKFVLVECRETFTGIEKPLYFADNKKRFEKFLDKIIHVVVEERLVTDSPWERETFQRNQIIRGLIGCHSKDYILISDVDEIPKGARICEMIGPIAACQTKKTGSLQKLFFFYLNRYNPDWTDWNGTIAVQFSYLLQNSPQECRDRRGEPPVIPDMGWHFTWMGGPKLISAKAFAQSHEGYTSNPLFTDEELFEELYKGYKILSIDEGNFPQFVVRNQDYLRGRGLLENVPKQL